MALFDSKGNVNQSAATELYQAASSQVTGDPSQYSPMGGVPLVGQARELADFEPLERFQLDQLMEMAQQCVASGFAPDTPVNISLQAMIQMVRSLEVLGAFCEDGAISDGSEEEEG